MADKKITELTELTTKAVDDLLVIVDTDTNTTKKITVANLTALGSDENYVSDAQLVNIAALDSAAYEPTSAFAPALGADQNYVTDNDITNLAALDTAAYSPAEDFAPALGGDDNYVTDAEKTAIGTIGDKAPSASPSFTGTVTLSDNARVDITLPTADTYCTGNTTDSFAAGYSSAVGDLVFFGSGGKWLEVDADAVATCQGLLGIALEAKTDTQIMKVALPGSMVRLDAWNWTVGATLYAGETLGAMQEAIPTGGDAVVKVVGFALSADVIYFNPSPDQQTVVA